MKRRSFLSVLSTALFTERLIAQEASQRIERQQLPPLRFLDRKKGRHAYQVRQSISRPHIFLITVDMISPDHWRRGRALRELMDLEALRELERESVVFDNAFCTSPLCAPARASLLTGRYSYITANGERAHDGHETTLRPDDVIFPEYLKAIGYVTKHCGKGHLGVQKFVDGFDENADAWDWWAPPIRRDEAYLAYLRQLGVKPQKYAREIHGLQQDRKSPANSLGGWIVQEDGKPFPIEAQYTHFLVDRALKKIDAARTFNPTAPIYLQLDIFDPHQPFSIPAGFEAREKELRKAVGLPRSYREVQRRNWERDPTEPKIYDFYRKNWGMYREETMLDYRVANALQIEVVDRALRKFFRSLREQGLCEEALIIFTADHGEMNGRRALVDKGVYLYPEVLRVPLWIKPPRSWQVRLHRVQAPVSHLDIAPTLFEIIGIEPAERLDGKSLLGLIRGEEKEADRELLFECGWHVGVNFACGFQRWSPSGEHYLYTYNLSSYVDELYDLNDEDPVNLAGQNNYDQVRREMIRQFGAFLEADSRWLGYWHSFRIDHYFDLPKRPGDIQLFEPTH